MSIQTYVTLRLRKTKYIKNNFSAFFVNVNVQSKKWMGYKVVLDTIDFHCVDKNRNIFKILFLFFTEKKTVKQMCNDSLFLFGK